MSVVFGPELGPTLVDDGRIVSLNQANACLLLRTLGYDPAEPYGEEDAEVFLGRVLIAQALAEPDPGQAWQQCGRWYTGGRDPGYLQYRLADLQDLAEHCRHHGLRVTWG